MFRRDTVRSTFEHFARESDLSRKSKSWYRRSDETIVVLTLTRRPYGRQYFLAVGIVLRALDADETPKDKDCQVRSRFDHLVPSIVEHRLNDLFDLDFSLADADRQDELGELFRSLLVPLLEASATLDGLRSGAGRDLVRRSVVDDAEARDLLSITSRR
jgi:hypothetical protein